MFPIPLGSLANNLLNESPQNADFRELNCVESAVVGRSLISPLAVIQLHHCAELLIVYCYAHQVGMFLTTRTHRSHKRTTSSKGCVPKVLSFPASPAPQSLSEQVTGPMSCGSAHYPTVRTQAGG